MSIRSYFQKKWKVRCVGQAMQSIHLTFSFNETSKYAIQALTRVFFLTLIYFLFNCILIKKIDSMYVWDVWSNKYLILIKIHKLNKILWCFLIKYCLIFTWFTNKIATLFFSVISRRSFSSTPHNIFFFNFFQLFFYAYLFLLLFD